ncbi:iron complex outermembrane recepter protein [Cnuella takakiae]|uniref:Iron complex outermembrane recepter protein n=1 Tax=Cnuella takakiae TaxID=1302690 RepID=A0A1M4Z769_9BACT|nr:TonB-dependent receptor [Cnuella takakiae]OLY94310.1 TonB-dependent siderophore receptor [Cnuella takakiae]SHF13798.1 iron complex outermembrane recepter protein [Cnuella takakiae]
MRLLATFFFFVCALTARSQVGLVGKIAAGSGESLQGATVILKGKSLNRSVLTDNKGIFLFTDLPRGNYTFTVNHSGFDSHVQAASIGGAPPDTIRITLAANSLQLQTVEVVGRSVRKYNSDYSFGATRIAALNKDIPQSIATITKELIADRQAFLLGDAVKLTSGVVPSSNYNQYAIRGISQNEEGQIINGMRTRQYYFLQPLTTNVERVEVIKGPSSATFASVDPGGSINLVTKKPLDVVRREVGINVGSFSTIRGTLDFTGPLNKEKTLLYRLNGAYQEARSYRDYVGNKSFLVSPSLTYLPNKKTAINAEMILSNMNGNLDRGQPIFGAVAGVTSLNSTPISLNLGAPNDFFRSKDFTVMGNIAHRFTNKIGFTAGFMKQTWSEDLQEHRTTNAFGVNMQGQPVNALAAMQFVQRRQFWNVDNLQAYFDFALATGPVQHKLLAGYDGSAWHKTKGGGQNAARGFLLRDGSVANTFVPANAANYQTITIDGVVVPRPNVPHFNLANPTNLNPNSDEYVLNVRSGLPPAMTLNHAVYLQDGVQWKRFTLLLSLRQEWFEDITNYKSNRERSFTQTVLLPRIGLTYAVTPNINVYGTYLKGFQPQSNTVTLMPNTGSFSGTAKSANLFEPLSSDLKEVGVKGSFRKNQLHLSAAAYEINQQNILMNANVPAFPDSLVTRGADRSRGFEVDLAGFLMPNWQINASYSYIDARVVSDSKAELVGARKENTPFNSANLWTRYNFVQGSFLKDMGLGVGVQHSGDKVPWFSRSFLVPAYTLLDLALYYTPGGSNMQLAVNLNNVTNNTYWVGAQNYLRLFPGAPRNVMISATYKF